MPISKDISNDQLKYTRGDTTGCSDNFVGGFVVGIARQLKANKLNLEAVVVLGIVSGGFACFYLGGTYFEKEVGEKWQKIKAYHEKYLKQIGK
ncbi:MAG: hypothetical protein MI975_03860 [Cytophagales bacterium]|nr:hypothetical protein [Cytophagales bacterium]